MSGDTRDRPALPLVLGITLGNLPAALFHELGTNASIDSLSHLGVLILLFEVGLECTVRGVLDVGASAARVAVLGTMASLGAGCAVAALLTVRRHPCPDYARQQGK